MSAEFMKSNFISNLPSLMAFAVVVSLVLIVRFSGANTLSDACPIRIVGVGSRSQSYGDEVYHCNAYTEDHGCVSFYSIHDERNVKLCGSYSIVLNNTQQK